MLAVAKAAKVSIFTVSAVVNGTSVVSDQRRERVEKAIRAIGYKRNAVARSLKTGRTQTIGVVIGDITNPFYTDVVAAIQQVLYRAGYGVMLCCNDRDVTLQEDHIAVLRDRRVDGLQHEDAFTGMRRDPHPTITATVFDLRQRAEGASAAVAEQHDRFRPPTAHPRCRGRDVARREVVQAVGVVVQVARRESEHGITRGREQRTRVVHREVAARVREHHRGLPLLTGGRRPEDPAHERAIGRDEPDRLALYRDLRVVFGQRPETETERTRGAE